MFKKIKTFYNKENFDYTSGYVDPFEYHQTFYILYKYFKVHRIEERTKFFNQNTIIFIMDSIALVLYFISFLHGVDNIDIPHMTETGAYCLLLIYMLIILTCTKYNLPEYLKLLESMKEDFEFICSTGEKYRTRYFKNQLKTWKICIPACLFIYSIVILMVSSTVLALILFLANHTPGDGKQRPLPFPIVLPGIDLHESPAYEILSVFLDIVTLLYGYGYVFMLQTHIVWVRHIASKADVITWFFQDLLDDITPTTSPQVKKYILKHRLADIVMRHQSMCRLLDDYSEVYKKLLLSEQIICGPLACLISYCTVLKLEEGEVHLVFIILFIGNFGAYLMPSVLGTFLLSKTTSVFDACWDIPFWDADPMIRPYIVLIMQRSLRPLPLQAPGFEEISIQTFSKKMSSAYSAFNMLRQVNL